VYIIKQLHKRKSSYPERWRDWPCDTSATDVFYVLCQFQQTKMF